MKLVTLTWRKEDDSWTSFNAIRTFTNALRTWAKRDGYAVDYLWMAEIQQRGALHVHLVVTGAPFLPREKLAEWWRHGWIDVRATDVDTATKYLVSYIGKGVGREEPADLARHLMHSGTRTRRFGCSRNISAKLDLIPAWVTEWAATNGADLELCEWEESSHSSRIYLFYDGELVRSIRAREVQWRILTELLSSTRPCGTWI